MEKKRWLPYVLKAPLVLIIIAAFIASIYAASVNLQGITWGTPIVFTIILGLFVLGWWFENKKFSLPGKAKLASPR
ncbi:hypothetical protein J4402_05555 [Candidatus Pacearchaeota archaeon]|nr:hypothetical protein [Candidatus Pacearchaeota archaeon]